MTRNARLLPGLFVLALAVRPGPAHAHAHLKASTPANQAVLTEAPATLQLEFSESARLTALSLQSGGEAMARKLPLSDPKSSVSHSVALPPLTAGDYVVTWRALSDDTHVSSGTLKFSVHPK